MPFPGTGKTSLATILASIKSTAGAIKDRCTQLNAAASITRKEVLDLANALADALQLFDSSTSAPGLLAYAQQQENNPLLDLTAEYTTMRAQLVATQDWIVANFPKDAGNNLSVYSFDVNKRFAHVALTAGQLSAFKTQLIALAATVN